MCLCEGGSAPINPQAARQPLELLSPLPFRRREEAREKSAELLLFRLQPRSETASPPLPPS